MFLYRDGGFLEDTHKSDLFAEYNRRVDLLQALLISRGISMNTKIKGTEEAWETGKLGQDEKFVKKSELTLDEMQALDNALELKAISIRMPNSLIDL